MRMSIAIVMPGPKGEAFPCARAATRLERPLCGGYTAAPQGYCALPALIFMPDRPAWPVRTGDLWPAAVGFVRVAAL